MPEIDSLIQHVDVFHGLTDQTYANLIKGSQLGIGPKLNYIDSMTPLIMPNAIIVTTHTPTMFDNIPYAKETICSLFESAPQSVDGIDPELTISEIDGIRLQNKQTTKAPGTTGISELNPTFVYTEVIGNYIQRFFQTWLRMMSHPDTGYSQLPAIFQSESIPPLIYSYFSADIMVIQPDITLQPENIIDAFFLACMWPKNSGGTIGIKRDVGGDGEKKERSVEFNSIVQWNANTYKIGQQILDLLQIHRMNFDYAKPVSMNIEDKLQDAGISKDIEDMKSELLEELT